MWSVVKRSPSRAVVVPQFGRLLEIARGARTLGAVVAKMHALSPEMQGFTRPQLVRYESGQTPRPDPVTLFYLAQLYSADVMAWIAALSSEREQLAIAAEKRLAAAGESPPDRRAVRGKRASFK